MGSGLAFEEFSLSTASQSHAHPVQAMQHPPPEAVDPRVKKVTSELVAPVRHLGNLLPPEQLNPDLIVLVRRAAASLWAQVNHEFIGPESKRESQQLNRDLIVG